MLEFITIISIVIPTFYLIGHVICILFIRNKWSNDKITDYKIYKDGNGNYVVKVFVGKLFWFIPIYKLLTEYDIGNGTLTPITFRAINDAKQHVQKLSDKIWTSKLSEIYEKEYIKKSKQLKRIQ